MTKDQMREIARRHGAGHTGDLYSWDEEHVVAAIAEALGEVERHIITMQRALEAADRALHECEESLRTGF